MIAFRSPVEMCVPPPGHSFAGGIWLTHDLDWEGLALYVLPALAGSGDLDPRRRAQAGRGLAAPLTVVAQQGRITGRPAGAAWQLLVASGPRRMHAKLAVLTFVKGSRTVTRAAVMSANLTAGGVGRNFEVLVSEEAVGGGSLYGAVLAALARLGEGDIGSAAVPLQRAVRAFQASDAAQDPRLVDSWSQPIPSLLRHLPGRDTESATELTIVDPGFATGAEADLTRVLREVFSAVRQVHLIVPEHPDGGAAFSPALWSGLRRAFPAVRHSVVRPGLGQRRLHAKALLWSGPGGGRALVGSANFTGRGLLGRNLEASALIDADAETLLAGLAHQPVKGAPTGPAAAEDEADGWPLVTGHAVWIASDRARRTLIVGLTLAVHGPWRLKRSEWHVRTFEGRVDAAWPPAVREDGRLLLCRDRPTVLDDSNWVVDLIDLAAKRELTVPVEVEGVPEETGAHDRDLEDPLPTTLARILQQLAPTSGGPGQGRRGRTADQGSVLAKPDDSLVHALARAALDARRGKSGFTVEDIRRDLPSIVGRLTPGERWALDVLLGGGEDDDMGRRFGAIVKGLL